jgi:SAM-dependent methyltransferase
MRQLNRRAVHRCTGTVPIAMLTDVRYDLNHGAPRRLLNESLARYASTLPSGTDVLEIGAGHYDHAPLFPDQRIVRFDMDPDQHPDIVGDAHAMPIEDGSFDHALCLSVLEHVRDPYQVVRETFRVLRPGGEVFAWVPFTFAVHGFPIDVTRFTREGLMVVFEEAGFEVVHADAERYSGLFMNLSNAVHFTLPRRSHRPWVRQANRALFLAARAGYPLDRRAKLSRMYAGTEIVVRKPV